MGLADLTVFYVDSSLSDSSSRRYLTGTCHDSGIEGMKTQREETSVGLEIFAEHLLDGFGLTIFFVLTFSISAFLVFRASPPTISEPRPFAGKIVEKRISV